MPRAMSILVAHSAEDVRLAITHALHDAGYECLDASHGEEALRFILGINPRLAIVEDRLARVPALELFARLKATGLALPPFLILADPGDSPAERPAESVYFVPDVGLDPEHLVRQVRLLTLAEEVGGELGAHLRVLYGDLARAPLNDLLRALRKHIITGRLHLKAATDTGLWIEDGDVVDAWWGDIHGRKAFNRVADLRSGSFELTLETAAVERTIDTDLGTLVGDAVEERLGLGEVLEALPSLAAQPRVQLRPDFFSLQFSPVEQRVLARVQESRTLAELLDRVPVPDLEVARAVTSLHQKGILQLTEPEHRIHLLTESTADLQPAEARRLGVVVLPVTILFGTEVYKDGVDLQPEDFQRKLRDANQLPTTSPVTRGELREAFRRMVASGDVLAVHPSAKISGTHANAEAAIVDGMAEFRQLRQQEEPDSEPTVLAVDTGQSSGPLAMLVIFASRMLRKGVPIGEVARRLAEMGRRTRTLLLVRSLESLTRTGDVDRGGAQKKAKGELRPILELTDGQLDVIDQVAGGPSATARLLDLLEERVDPTRPMFGSLVHASAPALAGELRGGLEHRFRIVELAERQMGPAVTCHVGPGAVGAALFEPSDEELDLLAPSES